MKIERFFYSEAKAEWEQQLEKMHRRQEALYLLEERSDAGAEDTDVEDESAYMEWISEVMDESKNTFLTDQPPVYTIANPKKYRQFKKVVNDAIELARAVRANLLVREENFTASIILVGDDMAFSGEEKQILDRLTELADDVAVKLSVDVGDGSPTDIDGIVQMEFWFDFYEEVEMEEYF
ncbi:MAG: hypothetical protein PUI69_00240 [bacterium]|nr:hypothetical protein [bacterium]